MTHDWKSWLNHVRGRARRYDGHGSTHNIVLCKSRALRWNSNREIGHYRRDLAFADQFVLPTPKNHASYRMDDRLSRVQNLELVSDFQALFRTRGNVNRSCPVPFRLRIGDTAFPRSIRHTLTDELHCFLDSVARGMTERAAAEAGVAELEIAFADIKAGAAGFRPGLTTVFGWSGLPVSLQTGAGRPTRRGAAAGSLGTQLGAFYGRRNQNGTVRPQDAAGT